MPFVLALDQGTTSSRALVFDQRGAVRGMAQQELRQIYPEPGWVEHDPTEIWATQSGVMHEALAKAGITGRDVAAIGITNQRETTLLWERATGASARERDRLAGPPDRARLRRAARGRPRGDVHREDGPRPRPLFLRHEAEVAARPRAGRAGAGRAGRARVRHGRHVARLEAHERGRARDRRLEREPDAALRHPHRDVGRRAPPTPRHPAGGAAPRRAFVGRRRDDDSRRRVRPIAGIAGDQQAALFGQACDRPGLAKNTYGTGCFLLLNTGAHAVASKNRLLTTVAWDLGGVLTYALEGSVFIGGAAVQWLRDGLKLIRTAADVEALAASEPDNGGVYIVPAFAGLGAPHWDAYARGAIFGLTRGSTAGHLARAVLESIAFQSADVLLAMEKDAGVALTELRVDGGATANELLMQFQADLLGVDVVKPEVPETTALGAAYLAGLAVGFWKDAEEIRANWRVARRFEPAMSRDRAAGAPRRLGEGRQPREGLGLSSTSRGRPTQNFGLSELPGRSFPSSSRSASTAGSDVPSVFFQPGSHDQLREEERRRRP